MKKIITLIIAVMMLFAVAACGGNNEPQDNITEQPETNPGDQPAAEGEGPVADDMGAADSDAAGDPDTSVSSGDTVGQTLLADFKAAAANGGTAEEIANAVIANENINFGPVVMPVEPGLLTGFDNAEITGFKEGVTFAPMIGTIPFVGYVFLLEDGADVDAFLDTLKTNANPRWNICTEAEETTIDHVDNYVFFLMSPMSFEG